jgi:hypothetical protein
MYKEGVSKYHDSVLRGSSTSTVETVVMIKHAILSLKPPFVGSAQTATEERDAVLGEETVSGKHTGFTSHTHSPAEGRRERAGDIGNVQGKCGVILRIERPTTGVCNIVSEGAV